MSRPHIDVVIRRRKDNGKQFYQYRIPNGKLVRRLCDGMTKREAMNKAQAEIDAHYFGDAGRLDEIPIEFRARRDNGKRFYQYRLPNGKLVRKVCEHLSQPEALQQARSEIAVYRDKQDALADPRPFFQEAFDRYWDEEIPLLKRSARQSAEQVAAYIGQIRLEDARDLAQSIRDDFAERLHNGDVQPATINRLLAVVRRVCNLAAKDWELIDHPPSIKTYREDNERHFYLSRDEVAELAAAATRDTVSDMINIAAYTGTRLGELYQLRPVDIDADDKAGYLRLRGETTKNRRPRFVPYPANIAEAIHRQPWRHLNRETLYDHWDKVREKAGFAKAECHWHDLRHTYASWVIQAGADLYVVMRLLGHKDFRSTQRYAHLSTEQLKAAVDLAFGPARPASPPPPSIVQLMPKIQAA